MRPVFQCEHMHCKLLVFSFIFLCGVITSYLLIIFKIQTSQVYCP